MTIAIGILANEGVVLAADRQATWPGYFKIESGKLGMSSRDGVSVLVSGSGPLSSLQRLMGDILDATITPQDSFSLNAIQRRTEGAISLFYKEHVIPHGRDVGLDADMIIGVRSGPNRRLLASNKTVVNDGGGFVSVGAGEFYTRNLMGQIRWAPMTTFAAVLLASHIILQTKESVDGCGKGTDIIFSSNYDSGSVPEELMAEMERLFSLYSETVSSPSIHAVCGQIGWPDDPPNNISKSIKKLKGEFAKLESIIVPNEAKLRSQRLTKAYLSHPQPSQESRGETDES